jgi:hypothetical protein
MACYFAPSNEELIMLNRGLEGRWSVVLCWGRLRCRGWWSCSSRRRPEGSDAHRRYRLLTGRRERSGLDCNARADALSRWLSESVSIWWCKSGEAKCDLPPFATSSSIAAVSLCRSASTLSAFGVNGARDDRHSRATVADAIPTTEHGWSDRSATMRLGDIRTESQMKLCQCHFAAD